eukprot:g17495.t1
MLDLPDQALAILQDIAEDSGVGGNSTDGEHHLQWFDELVKEYHKRLHTKDQGKGIDTKIAARISQWERQKSLARLSGAVRSAENYLPKLSLAGGASRDDIFAPSSGRGGGGSDLGINTSDREDPRTPRDVSLRMLGSAGSSSVRKEVDQLRRDISFALFTQTPGRAGSKGEVDGAARDPLDEGAEEVEIPPSSCARREAGTTSAAGDEPVVSQAVKLARTLSRNLDQTNAVAGAAAAVEKSSHGGAAGGEPGELVPPFTRREKLTAFVAFVVSVLAVVIMIVWHPHQPEHHLHTAKLVKYNAFITAPLYPLVENQPLVKWMEREGGCEVIDLKMFAGMHTE